MLNKHYINKIHVICVRVNATGQNQKAKIKNYILLTYFFLFYISIHIFCIFGHDINDARSFLDVGKSTLTIVLFNFHALDCLLYAVGKPVYHKFTEQNYGAWLKDASPKLDMMKTDALEKIWATKENDSMKLYEYVNKSAYRTNTPTKTYRLQFGFKVRKMKEIKYSIQKL